MSYISDDICERYMMNHVKTYNEISACTLNSESSECNHA